jgi:DNA-binding transcriptional regulator YdaS (Cro superfamily)
LDPKEAIEKVASIVGNPSKLASALEVRPQHTWNWINRDGRVAPDYAIRCHKLVDGEVTIHQLRPDLYPEGVVKMVDS